MAISLTKEDKNTLTLSNEDKVSGGTFGSFPGRTFGEGGTFGLPRISLERESKNSLTITNESKN